MTTQALVPHELDTKKLWDSTVELSACKRITSHDGRNPKTTIVVPILTCRCLWKRFQREAEDWIAPGGVLIADPQARNRRINAAYAQLWLADNRFQWAGLAAFASKQVGCGLLHAVTLDERIEAEKKAYQQLRDKAPQDLLDRRRLSNIRPKSEEWHAWDQARQQNPLPQASNPLLGGAVATLQDQLKYVHEMLALGNTALFLDVYPLHRFYMVRGFEEMQTCLEDRNSLKDEVIWPIADKVEFGALQIDVSNSFRAIESGNIAKGVEFMASHEQLNILQPAMYDEPDFAKLMQGTQAGDVLSIVTGLFTGISEEIQLTLASQCKVTDDRRISFSSNPFANLADKNQRMEFVVRAATQFDQLLKNPITRAQLERSIFEISTGMDIKP